MYKHNNYINNNNNKQQWIGLPAKGQVVRGNHYLELPIIVPQNKFKFPKLDGNGTQRERRSNSYQYSASTKNQTKGTQITFPDYRDFRISSAITQKHYKEYTSFKTEQLQTEQCQIEQEQLRSILQKKQRPKTARVRFAQGTKTYDTEEKTGKNVKRIGLKWNLERLKSAINSATKMLEQERYAEALESMSKEPDFDQKAEIWSLYSKEEAQKKIQSQPLNEFLLAITDVIRSSQYQSMEESQRTLVIQSVLANKKYDFFSEVEKNEVIILINNTIKNRKVLLGNFEQKK